MARNYQKEYKEYHSKPKQMKDRAMRNAARAIMKNVAEMALYDSDIVLLAPSLNPLPVSDNVNDGSDNVFLIACILDTASLTEINAVAGFVSNI